MYIRSHPSLPSGRRDVTLYDVTPTTLKLLGQDIPPDLVGEPLA